MIKHTIPPVYDANSRILVLGSFPSVKSREQQFFYGHKQNRFWKVLAGILGCGGDFYIIYYVLINNRNMALN